MSVSWLVPALSGSLSVDLVFVASGSPRGLRDSFRSHVGTQCYGRGQRIFAGYESLSSSHPGAGSDVLERGGRRGVWYLSSFH